MVIDVAKSTIPASTALPDWRREPAFFRNLFRNLQPGDVVRITEPGTYWYGVEYSGRSVYTDFLYGETNSNLLPSLYECPADTVLSDDVRGSRCVACSLGSTTYQSLTSSEAFSLAAKLAGHSKFNTTYGRIADTKLVNASGGEVRFVVASTDTLSSFPSLRLNRVDYLGYLVILNSGVYFPVDEADGITFIQATNTSAARETSIGTSSFFNFREITWKESIPNNPLHTVTRRRNLYTASLFDGWYVSPRVLKNCTFVGCRTDFKDTVVVENCVFDNVLTGVSLPFEKGRKGIVDSCIFKNNTVDGPVVEAPMVLNSLFRNNDCSGFTVGGFASNCAFVGNKAHVGPIHNKYIATTGVLNSYLFENSFFVDGSEKELPLIFCKCVHDGCVVSALDEYRFDVAEAEPKTLKASYDSVRDRINFYNVDARTTVVCYTGSRVYSRPDVSRTFDPSKKLFDDRAIIYTSGVLTSLCLKIDTPHDFVVESDTPRSPDYLFTSLLGTGLLIGDLRKFVASEDILVRKTVWLAGFKYIAGYESYARLDDSIRFVDPAWISLYSVFLAMLEYSVSDEDLTTLEERLSSDMLGNRRNNNFISIGPVESTDWQTKFKCVKASLDSGFGKISPGIQFVLPGSEATITVTSPATVNSVVVNGVPVSPAKILTVRPSDDITRVNVSTGTDIFVDSSIKNTLSAHEQHGSVDRPFENLDMAVHMISLANFGRYSLEAFKISGVNLAYVPSFYDGSLSMCIDKTTVHVGSGTYTLNFMQTTAAALNRGVTVLCADNVHLKEVGASMHAVGKYTASETIQDMAPIVIVGNETDSIEGRVFTGGVQSIVISGFTLSDNFAPGMVDFGVKTSQPVGQYPHVERIAGFSNANYAAEVRKKLVFCGCRLNIKNEDPEGTPLFGTYVACDIVPEARSSYRADFVYCDIHDQKRISKYTNTPASSQQRRTALYLLCVIRNCLSLGHTINFNKCHITYFPDNLDPRNTPEYYEYRRSYELSPEIIKNTKETHLSPLVRDLGQITTKQPGTVTKKTVFSDSDNSGAGDPSIYSQTIENTVFFTNSDTEKGLNIFDEIHGGWRDKLYTASTDRLLMAERSWYRFPFADSYYIKSEGCLVDKPSNNKPGDYWAGGSIQNVSLKTYLLNKSEYDVLESEFFKALCAVVYGVFAFRRSGITMRPFDLYETVSLFVRMCALEDTCLKPAIIDRFVYDYTEELIQWGMTLPEIASIYPKKDISIDLSCEFRCMYNPYEDLEMPIDWSKKKKYPAGILANMLVNAKCFTARGKQFPLVRRMDLNLFKDAVLRVYRGDFAKYDTVLKDGKMYYADEYLGEYDTQTLKWHVARALGRNVVKINGTNLSGVYLPEMIINEKNGEKIQQ